VGGRTLLSSIWAHSNYSAKITASFQPPTRETLETTDTVPIVTGGRDYFDGDTITVYYDPANPKKAKLRLPSSGAIARKIIIPSVLGLVLVFFGLALLPASLQSDQSTVASSGGSSSGSTSSGSSSASQKTEAEVASLGAAPSGADPSSFERAKRGESLFQTLLSQKKAEPPKVWGMLKAVRLNVGIEENAWNHLSKSQQVDLSYYAENMIARARANAEPYASVAPSDNYYKYALNDVRNLCASCWCIVLKTQGRDGLTGFQDMPVAGEAAWESQYANFPEEKTKKAGSKASSFRKQNP
jgi:hypothetical protein